jgi:hypothetical protein
MDAAKTLLLTGEVPPQYITGPCPPQCTAGAALVDSSSRTPYAEQASFEMNREIGKGYTASIGYLFVAAHHQVRAEDLTVSPPVGTLPDGKALFNGPLYGNDFQEPPALAVTRSVPPTDNCSRGTFGSMRCSCHRSMTSVLSRRRLFSTSGAR